VFDFSKNETVAVKTLTPERKLVIRFNFKSKMDGTRIYNEWQLETGVPRIIQGLAAKRIKTAELANLIMLKELLET
jgi:hypothetical protein